jgi:MFS family permease
MSAAATEARRAGSVSDRRILDASTGGTPVPLQHEWHLIAGLLPGLLLVMANVTLLALASTEVVNGLNSDRYRIQWIMGCYSAGFMFGAMTTALVAAQIGLSRCFAGSLLLFALASTLAGAAGTIEAMVPARLMQGYAKGLALNSAMILLWQHFPGQITRWMALYGSIAFAGALLGAPLGGLLTTWLSWRALFLFQAAAAAVAVLAAWWGLPDDRPAVRAPLRLDLVHVVLTLGWLICLTVVLDMGQFWGWLDSPKLVTWLAGFVVFFAVFVAWGLLRSEPLISLRLLLRPRYAAAITVLAIYASNIYVLIGMLSGYFIDLRRYQWWQGSALFAPLLPCMLAGVLAGAWGKRRLRLVLGLGIMALTTWRVAAVDLYVERGWIALQLALWSFGAGLATVPAMQAVFEGLSTEETFSQAGIFNLNRFLPAFVVGAALATLLSRRTDAELDRLRLNVTHNRPVIQHTIQHLRGELSAHNGLPNGPARQARAALTRWVRANARGFAVQTVLGYLALLTGAGVVLALGVPTAAAGRPAAPADDPMGGTPGRWEQAEAALKVNSCSNGIPTS